MATHISWFDDLELVGSDLPPASALPAGCISRSNPRASTDPRVERPNAHIDRIFGAHRIPRDAGKARFWYTGAHGRLKHYSKGNEVKQLDGRIADAVIYARYSTEHQTQASIADQVRRCREYAEKNSLKVKGEFSDEGISGAAIGNRPGVQKAMAAAESGDVLLVMDTTRLSRSQDLAPLLTRLRHRGVKIIGVLDGYDSTSPTSRMQAGLSGIMSEEFRAQIANRTHSALDMRARSGKATGGKCYGYSSTGGIVETQAEVVREIFLRASVGESQRSIATGLNARGVPSPGADWNRKNRRSDGLWLVSAINSMLSNERYVGRIKWNTSLWKRDPDTGRRQRVERPESEWVKANGAQIIDQTTWEKVRALATPRKLYGGKRGGGPKYLLSGILVCSQCGHRLIATGENGSWYYCGTHRHGGNSACSMSVGARRDVAEEKLLEPIQRDLLSAAAVDLAIELMNKWTREETVSAVSPPQVEELDQKIERIERQIENGVLDRGDMAPALAALNDRRRAALAASKRQTVGSSAFASKAAGTAYRSAAVRMREVLQGPVAQARAAMHEILGSVECQSDGAHLTAMVQLNPIALWQSAGLAWNGSGGRI